MYKFMGTVDENGFPSEQFTGLPTRDLTVDEWEDAKVDAEVKASALESGLYIFEEE